MASWFPHMVNSSMSLEFVLSYGYNTSLGLTVIQHNWSSQMRTAAVVHGSFDGLYTAPGKVVPSMYMYVSCLVRTRASVTSPPFCENFYKKFALFN